LGFGGFSLWAALAPIPEGVLVPGTLVPNGSRKLVDALTSGRIVSLNVVDGAYVEKNQLLAIIDSTAAKAEVESASARRNLVVGKIDRLEVELGISHESSNLVTDRSESDDSIQSKLRVARSEAELQNSRSLHADLRSAKSLVNSGRQAVGMRDKQLALISDQLKNMRILAEEGLIPRNRYLELQRSYFSIQAELERERNGIRQAEASVEKIAAEIERIDRSRDAERYAELADLISEMESLNAALDAARSRVLASRIVSPESGYVIGLSVHTEGAYVQAGQRMMEVVSPTAEVIAEGALQVDRIADIEVGDRVDIGFTAVDRNSSPRGRGTITNISADRIIDQQNGQPYYKISVRMDGSPSQLKQKIGMPVEIFVRSGERTLFGYLVKPVVDRARTGWEGERTRPQTK